MRLLLLAGLLLWLASQSFSADFLNEKAEEIGKAVDSKMESLGKAIRGYVYD